jgi:IS30 family transposase
MELFKPSSNGASTMARHLTPGERDLLAEWLAAGHSLADIARALDRDPSTIFRELQRNGCCGGYHATAAQRRCDTRQREAHRKRRKLLQPEIRKYVIKALQQEWSPDEIAGRLRRDFSADSRRRVSAQTIYHWIRHDRGRVYRPHLRRCGKVRHRRTPSQPRPGLEQRPAVINERARCGDWEGDTIVSAGHVSASLLTLVERLTGYTLILPIPKRKAEVVKQAIIRRMRSLPPALRRSLTFDNGPEFSDWQTLADMLQLDVFFAHPHCPWERGTNENTNGLIRQYFPKGTRFDAISRSAAQQVQEKLNNRPRKRLQYQTPNEVLRQHCCRAIQT